MTASMATDLPEPDSPTMASTSFGCTTMSMPSTALKAPPRVAKATLRPRTSSRGVRHDLRIFGSSASRRPSPIRLIDTTVIRIARPGSVTMPGIGADELARVGQHRAPLGGGRLRAQAEEAQRRRLEDRVGHAERGLHDQRRQAVGQHGHEHQPPRPDAGHARGDDVVLAEFGQRRRAHAAARSAAGRRWSPRRWCWSRLGPSTATTRIASTRLGTAMIRSITRVIATSTALPERHAGQAQQHADDERDAHHRQADEQRDARAVDQAREHVAAQAVGAEQEARAAAVGPDRRRRTASRNCSIGR